MPAQVFSIENILSDFLFNLKMKNKSEATIRAYGGDIRSACKGLENTSIEDADQFLNSLELNISPNDRGLKPTTVNRKLSALTSLKNHLNEAGYLQNEHSFNHPLKKNPGPLIRPIKAEEYINLSLIHI